MFLHRLLRLLRTLLASLGSLVLLVAFTPVVSWYSRLLAGLWEDPRGDVLSVFAGGTIDSETLAPDSYWRSVYAVHA
jgi:hypothetical protein